MLLYLSVVVSKDNSNNNSLITIGFLEYKNNNLNALSIAIKTIPISNSTNNNTNSNSNNDNSGNNIIVQLVEFHMVPPHSPTRSEGMLFCCETN